MSKVPQEKVDRLLDDIHKNIPDFQIIYKEDPDWWKTNFSTFFVWLFFEIISFFSKTNYRRFYNNYSNGIHGNTMAFPDRKRYGDLRDKSVYRIMRHEYIHLRDQRKHPIWFALSYSFVLPVVLTMRAYWEIRGYTATMLTYYEERGEVPVWLVDTIVQKFTGSMYLWMLPFPKWIRSIVEDKKAKIESGEISGLYF